MDFLLVLIGLFLVGFTAEALRGNTFFEIGDFAPTGAGWPKISGRRASLPTNHSSSRKIRLNDFSYGIKIWTDLSSVLSQWTRLTDGRTDRQTCRRTAFSSLDRAGKNRLSYIRSVAELYIWTRTMPIQFLQRCMKCRRGLAMRILSVCPSVTHVIGEKMKKDRSRFLYHMKEHWA